MILRHISIISFSLKKNIYGQDIFLINFQNTEGVVQRFSTFTFVIYIYAVWGIQDLFSTLNPWKYTSMDLDDCIWIVLSTVPFSFYWLNLSDFLALFFFVSEFATPSFAVWMPKYKWDIQIQYWDWDEKVGWVVALKSLYCSKRFWYSSVLSVRYFWGNTNSKNSRF